MTVDEGETGTLRIRFLTNNALELNDKTTDIADHPGTGTDAATISQVGSITFSAPQIDVEIL